MKKKSTAALGVLMCAVLVLSTFAACGAKKKNAEPTTLVPNDNWQAGVEETYAPVNITSMELADLVNEALGEEAKGFNGDLNTLSAAQKTRVTSLAAQKGYTVTEDSSGNTVIQKEDVPVTPASQDEVNEILTKAGVNNLTSLTPSEYSRVSREAAENGATALSRSDGSVEIVKTTLPVTTRRVNTTAGGAVTNPTGPAATTAGGAATTAGGGATTATPVVTQPTTKKPTAPPTAGPTYKPPTTGYVAPAGTTLSAAKYVKPNWVVSQKLNGNTLYSANATTGDGGSVCVGASLGVTDGVTGSGTAVITKYNDKGNEVWTDKIQGNDYFNFEDVAVLTDGSIIVVGDTMATNLASDAEYKCKDTVEAVIVKYSASGNRQWLKLVGGSANDMFYSVAATPDGGFVAGGKSNSVDMDLKNVGTAGPTKAICFKYDPAGNVAWKTAVAGSKHCSFDGLATNSAGTIFASVSSACTDGDFATLQNTINNKRYSIAMCLTPAGKISWATAACETGAIQMPSIAASPDGGCVLAGSYFAGREGNKLFLKNFYNGGTVGTYDGLVAKFNSAGGVAWIKPLIGFESDYINGITPVKDGYAVCGYTKSTNRDFNITNQGDYDGYVYIISEYGATQTVTPFGGGNADIPRGICSDGGNKLRICGYTNSGDGYFSGVSPKGDTNATVGFESSMEIARS